MMPILSNYVLTKSILTKFNQVINVKVFRLYIRLP